MFKCICYCVPCNLKACTSSFCTPCFCNKFASSFSLSFNAKMYYEFLALKLRPCRISSMNSNTECSLPGDSRCCFTSLFTKIFIILVSMERGSTNMEMVQWNKCSRYPVWVNKRQIHENALCYSLASNTNMEHVQSCPNTSLCPPVHFSRGILTGNT